MILNLTYEDFGTHLQPAVFDIQHPVSLTMTYEVSHIFITEKSKNQGINTIRNSRINLVSILVWSIVFSPCLIQSVNFFSNGPVYTTAR